MLVYPMFAMVVLTVVVGVIALIARIQSVKAGSVKVRSFKLMDADDFPKAVVQTTRNFNNQFEIPVLLYVACVSYLALELQSPFAVFLAWTFVALRAAHTYIHITYNHLLHRMIVFWLAIFVVLALWINLIVQMLGR